MDLHEAFIGFLCDRYDIPGRFLWDSYGISMIYIYLISMTFLGVTMGVLLDSCGTSIVCL